MRNGLWIIVVGGVVGAMLASTALAAKSCQPNGVLTQGEGCDPVGPVFRGGATCQTLGFDGDTLACTITCQVDQSGCFLVPCAVFPGDGVDGPALSYTDNRDGTATDNNTLLMWEQKVPGSVCLHCVSDAYTFADTIGSFLNLINTVDGIGLGGHSDWRIPNAKELQSIVGYGHFPVIAFSFPGVTAAADYWSSTPDASGGPSSALSVNFGDGSVSGDFKVSPLRVRAVRGGR